MLEFTGERVVPGQIDADLWNEHLSRYSFAARLARGRRVLDVACGTGYGTAELSRVAQLAVGIDVAADAVTAASSQYRSPNLSFLVGDARQLPFKAGTFDLLVAFEVIEHLQDWNRLLEEARRLLAPGGQFVVSTPNRVYYAESRQAAGANPFHVHEFEFAEFEEALRSFFPSVSLFLQDHAPAIVFHAARSECLSAVDVHVQAGHPDPEHSHFFLAVCALAQQTGSPTYVYLPAVTNVLREREQHIAKLDAELARKNEWLEALKTEHAALVDLYRKQSGELSATHAWGESLQAELEQSGYRIAALQAELEQQQAAAREAVSGYEAKVASLEREMAAQRDAAQSRIDALETELTAKCAELAKCVDLLHSAEATVEERTQWAQTLQREVEALNTLIATARASRWLRLGRAIGLGPELSGKS